MSQITFDEDEDIRVLSGTFGPYLSISNTVITSLKIKTNKQVHGPFGTVGNEGNESFSLPVTKGKIAGFFGRHGPYINSIGAILVHE